MRYFAEEAGNKLGSDHSRFCFFRARSVNAALKKILTEPYTLGYVWQNFDLYAIYDEKDFYAIDNKEEPAGVKKVATVRYSPETGLVVTRRKW